MEKRILKVGSDQVALYIWKIEDENNKLGSIQICHGIAEHMARYDEFARFLNDYGFEVWGHDHPGHGLTSENSLGYVKGDAMSHLLSVMGYVREEMLKENENLPIILFGHSMGSFLSLRFMEVYPHSYDALILSGTNGRNGFLLEKISKFLTNTFARGEKDSGKISKGLFNMYNIGFPGKGNFRWLNSIEEEVEKYEKDPLCGFPISDSFIRSLVDGLGTWYKDEEIGRLNRELPVLLISGAFDPVGNKGKGVVKLAKSMVKHGMKSVYLRLYEGARHEILFEKTKKETMNDIISFIESLGSYKRKVQGE